MQIGDVRRVTKIPTPIWVLILAFGCGLIAIAPSAASTGTTIQVSSGSGAVGQTLGTTVVAALNSSDTVNGFDIAMTFDASVVHVASITVGADWLNPPLAKTFDNSAGTIHVAAFQLGTGCASSSNCALFTISWLAVGGGASSAHISGVQLSGSDAGHSGALASVAAFDGTLSVSGGATAVPTTATAAPTTATAAPTTATAAPTTAVPTTVTATATAAAATPTAAPATSTATTPPPAPTSAGSAATASATAVPAVVETSTPPTSEPTAASTPTAPTPVVAAGSNGGAGGAGAAPAVITTPASAPSGPASAAGHSLLPPLPPATGSAGASVWAGEHSAVQLSGWLLVVMSLLVLGIRGGRAVAPKRPSPPANGGGSGGSGGGSSSAADERPIEHVVGRYLAQQESAAMLEAGRGWFGDDHKDVDRDAD